MTSTGCPDPEDLENLLQDTLDPERDRPLLEHLADCPACRRRLEWPVDGVDVGRWKTFWNQHVPEPIEHGAGAPPPGPTRSLPDPFDGYEIVRLIGRGGMSVVYEARQTRLNRPVALKMLLAGAHASPAAIARLRSESETIAGLRHPNIVTIHDIGEHQGVPYLCLELIEGGSLADRLNGRPLPPSEARRLVAILARTVQDAHDQGVIHRDLKPANVLVDHPAGTPPEGWSRLRLTDFGLARRLEDPAGGPSTRTGDVVGTPAYMAPEQVLPSRSRVGPATDVYGLGALLYELLTGRPPFQGDSPFEMAILVISQPPVPPRALNPDVPADLEALCLRCLSKDPSLRPGSARELADALEAGGSVEPAPRGNRRPLRLALWLLTALTLSAALATLWRPGAASLSPKTAPVPSFYWNHEIHVLPPGEPYQTEGRLVVPGVTDGNRPPERVISFDLCPLHEELHRKHWVKELTKHADVYNEPYNPIRYWRPVDPERWAEVVYRYDFDFPVRSAVLFASLKAWDTEARGELHVAIDPLGAWRKVCVLSGPDSTGGYLPIGPLVRGSRTVLVKARFKGRDDGKGSSLAQFLRSSTRPGDLHAHGPDVFELRACEHEIPFVRLEARYGVDTPWIKIGYSMDEGTFHLGRASLNVGRHLVQLRATFDDGTSVLESRRVVAISPDCRIAFEPRTRKIRVGERYTSTARVTASPPGRWSGSVDYGDETGEEKITPELDGQFRLEHRYGRAGHHKVYLIVTDERGRTTTEAADCAVSE